MRSETPEYGEPMPNSYVKAAVVQAAPNLSDLPGTMSQVETLIQQAADRDASLVVFPEAFIGGYPKGAGFGASVGMRSDEGRALFQRYYHSAIDLNGPELGQLCKWAAEAGVFLVIGIIERCGGTLYCSTLLIDQKGVLQGKHRKVMPTGVERLIWGFGDGSTLPVVESGFGRVGSAICWENYMPQLRMSLYQGGVQFYCASTVDDRDSWIPSMQHIAIEGRCFVLSACQYATRARFPDNYECVQGDNPDTVMIRGGSCIVDPFGKILAGPIYDRDAIITADLDTDLITRGKYDLDVVGHYARPDIFTLSVDRRPKSAVTFSDCEPGDGSGGGKTS